MGTVPNTFATMSAGNVPAADLDANFSALVGLTGSVTAGHAAVFTGSGNNIQDGGAPFVPRSYLAGLALSNDGSSPNSVLDIAAGMATDSTQAVLMSIGAWTKSTGGSFVAGTGQNGMGQGLTIADSTWYHVFLIINGGAADIYFDTSITAANAPTSTTAYRRIGSFKTDGSAHILAFYQNGDTFQWSAPTQDFDTTPPTSGTLETLNVPPGVIVGWFGTLGVTGGSPYLLLTSPNVQDPGAPTGTFASIAPAGSAGYTWMQPPVLTNTSQQLRLRASSASGTCSIYTFGWIDRRGRDA